MINFNFIFRECLHEISLEQLQNVLNILENVSESEMKVSNIDILLLNFIWYYLKYEIINEIGEYLYQKYAPQIFLLKFYEDNLRTHT